jgi:hypothetical protein
LPWAGVRLGNILSDVPETYLSVAGPLGEVFEPRWADLQDATDENPFIHAGVELLKSAIMLAHGLTDAPREGPMPINAAIRCGLMVRAGKLCLDLLADVCNGQGRQQVGLLRQLTETLANVVYLCRDDEQGTRHRAYLYDSLISEREFLRVIERRRASGDGTELPIEGRLRRSIEDTAQAAGIDLDTIPGRRQIGWPSAQDRIEQAFGATAYPSYRVGSDALHGGWFDLVRNHLNQVDGGFDLEFRPASAGAVGSRGPVVHGRLDLPAASAATAAPTLRGAPGRGTRLRPSSRRHARALAYLRRRVFLAQADWPKAWTGLGDLHPGPLRRR